jgi:hypothetical protein
VGACAEGCEARKVSGGSGGDGKVHCGDEPGFGGCESGGGLAGVGDRMFGASEAVDGGHVRTEVVGGGECEGGFEGVFGEEGAQVGAFEVVDVYIGMQDQEISIIELVHEYMRVIFCCLMWEPGLIALWQLANQKANTTKRVFIHHNSPPRSFYACLNTLLGRTGLDSAVRTRPLYHDSSPARLMVQARPEAKPRPGLSQHHTLFPFWQSAVSFIVCSSPAIIFALGEAGVSVGWSEAHLFTIYVLW